ncbi:MAG: rod shape-determining protein MreC [Methylacidiphilales bacterium]|nr:rod shape-determining protein MreC [Candidatus Methylacidiphilales bacterium]
MGVFISGMVLAVIFLSPEKAKEKAREKLFDWLHGIFESADRARSFVGNIQAGRLTVEQLQEQVKALQMKVNRLETENAYFRELSVENARLREMLNFKRASSFQLLAAKVVERDPSAWWSTVIVNRGWKDVKGIPGANLDRDLPVISPRGVVGKTGQVMGMKTEVILIFNENSHISVATEGTNVQGIVKGGGVGKDGRPLLRMIYIDRDAQIAPGERLFTTGLGGTFPAGLYVGSVLEVLPLRQTVNFGLNLEAIVDPAIDPSKIDDLFIILKPE